MMTFYIMRWKQFIYPQVFQFPIYDINVFQDVLHAFNKGFDEFPQTTVMSLGNAGDRLHKGQYYQPFLQTW